MSCCLKKYAKKTVVLTPLTTLTTGPAGYSFQRRNAAC